MSTRSTLSEKLTPEECLEILGKEGAGKIRGRKVAVDLALRPEVKLEDVEDYLPGGKLQLTEKERESLEIRLKYRGYIEKQRRTARRMIKMESVRIPERIKYADIDAISAEAREKLEQFRPETLGQASRIAGVRSADLSVLMVLLERGFRAGKGDGSG